MQNAKCKMQNAKLTKYSQKGEIGGDETIFVLNEGAKAQHSKPM